MSQNEYEKLKQNLQAIEVPQDKLHQARQQAFSKYKRNQQIKRRTTKQFIFAAILILTFITSIRVSPAFAQTVAKIPGFAALVEMITQDKGVKDIVENEYYEELNIVQTKNKLTLTILGTIADESGMIIFYQLEAPYDISELQTTKHKLTQNGKDIEASSGYSWAPKDPTNVIQEKIEIVSSKQMDYTNPNFEITLSFGDDARTTFNVPFTLTQPIKASKQIEINQTIEIEGQKLHVDSIKVSPLRAEIKLTDDPDNTQQILQIGELKVLDEHGEEWGTITNGITGFGGFREEQNSLFIQSNYFREPQSLTLVIDQVEAMPKGEDYIEIDFLKGEIVKMPKLHDFELTIRGSSIIDVKYPDRPNHHRQLFSSVFDANGKQFYSTGHSVSGIDGKEEASYTFDLKDAVNPVRLYFVSYPIYLEGSAEIHIPLKGDDNEVE
ncbi:uncharacterized protein DUF4179 [Ureibacillus xyleni]|uniref:Uncharacterized protein DUF4179 n=1 Tax=Ureibacillus xyleni TaxID=614648 RepID=A0A285TTX4_9BACL|nr:DUF4179 domain-containing protein [Ureibacillus xyleni]SOC27563.1 uncharacterized protein DUF4179 [Ureibacillus xyleni]